MTIKIGLKFPRFIEIVVGENATDQGIIATRMEEFDEFCCVISRQNGCFDREALSYCKSISRALFKLIAKLSNGSRWQMSCSMINH
jgi:hypothetical protein